MAKKPIGEFLADLRREKGYTQKQVADMLGISNRTLSAWEQGRAYPDVLTLPALAKIYGVTADEILNGERRESALIGQPFSGAGADKSEEKAASSADKTGKNADSSGDSTVSTAKKSEEETLIKFSFKINLLTVIECVGIAVFAMGIVLSAMILWLGCLLFVLGICAVITSVGLTCVFGNGAFALLCGREKPPVEMSEQKRRYAVCIGRIISRFYMVGGAVWCAVFLICFAAFIPVENNLLTAGLITTLLPLALGAICLAAGLISRVVVKKKYGSQSQKATVKSNGKLLKKCCAFALIPVLLACGVMVFFNYWRSEKVLFSGGEEQFKTHMHTLIVGEGVSEPPSGEYVLDFSGVTGQVYAPVGYGFEACLNSALDCMYLAYRVEENSKDYLSYDLCTAYRLIVEGSDLVVYNVRYASNAVEYTSYEVMRYVAKYADGNYELIKSVSYAQEGYLAGILIIIATLAVGFVVYLVRRKKLPE
ncbi:MAG: helix-turn-helix domain-containing protein [Candidatus Coproplasma sp.]